MPDKDEIVRKAGAVKPPKEASGDSKYEDLAKQIRAEYYIAWKHQKPKKYEAELRLKLYNNQKRDKKAVGDTTMFAIFQAVFASLYVDRLNVEFGGKEEGDDEVADNLDSMARADYTDMEKDELDYTWIWDTMFFGRGYVGLHEYERDPKNGIYLPVPNNIDPLTFLRDTIATSINGNRRGDGSARFFGSEIKMTEEDIDQLPSRLDSFRMSELTFGSGT